MKRGKEKKSKSRGVIIFIIIVAVAISLIIFTFSKPQEITANVALIRIENIILTSESGFIPYAASYADEIIAQLEEAITSPRIKAVIFEIDSSGGSAVAASEIAAAIKKAKEANKTTIALIREQATSGAYWIASSCEHIISHPLSITGSIGVLTAYLEFSGLLERFNVTYERLVKGEHKDILSPFRKMSEKERALLETKLELIYNTFIQEVALNRNLSQEQVRQLADGLFYLGKEAKDLGLVDQLGSRDEAIAYIEAKHGIKARIKEWKRRPTLLEELSRYLLLSYFWLGRGIGASLVDRNLILSLNPVIPQA